MSEQGVEHVLLRPDPQFPKRVMPVFATEGAAAMDLASAVGLRLHPGTFTKIHTGWEVEVPPGYELQIRPRSGLASRGIVAMFGTVDADYRGPLMVTVANLSPNGHDVQVGDRIAQAVLSPVQRWACIEVSKLTETARGKGGFGSTGR